MDDDRDDRALAELTAEREQLCIDALYEALMLGLPEEQARILARECGIKWAMIESTHRSKITDTRSA